MWKIFHLPYRLVVKAVDQSGGMGMEALVCLPEGRKLKMQCRRWMESLTMLGAFSV